MKYVTTYFDQLLVRLEPESFVTSDVPRLFLNREGITGEVNAKHHGHFVKANVRNKGFHRKGDAENRDVIFNHSQISVIDLQSLREIGEELDIDPDIVARDFDETREQFIARHMGMNVVVGTLSSGEKLHDIAPPYHLGPFDDDELFTASMLVMSYNEPCVRPGRAIAEAYPGASESMGAKFVEVARARRGFVGVVSLAGRFTVGQQAMIVPLPKVPNEAAA